MTYFVNIAQNKIWYTMIFLYQKDNKILVHVETVLISYIYGFECTSKGETIS